VIVNTRCNIRETYAPSRSTAKLTLTTIIVDKWRREKTMRIRVTSRPEAPADPPARTRWGRLALPSVAALSLLAGDCGGVPGPGSGDHDGLALWYKLDAQSGTAAVDSSGNGRDGTVNGTATWTAGRA